jgi:hypothetical protein
VWGFLLRHNPGVESVAALVFGLVLVAGGLYGMLTAFHPALRPDLPMSPKSAFLLGWMVFALGILLAASGYGYDVGAAGFLGVWLIFVLGVALGALSLLASYEAGAGGDGVDETGDAPDANVGADGGGSSDVGGGAAGGDGF